MGTKVWGPSFWYVLHLIADSSPQTIDPTVKSQYQSFFQSLPTVLPCPTCGIHLRGHMETHPPKLDTREDMIQWVNTIHNEANKMLNKKT